jgi:YHS domain-containing protein
VQIVKIILYAFLIYVIYLLIRFFRTLSKVKKSAPPPKPVSDLMVKDQMCNTYLPKEEAIKEIYQGKEYYFCSDACRHKFLEQKKTR